MNVFNIVIAGVGGQGVLMASKVLAESALASGMDVKQNEVHGMAQRGGSVISFVRIGERVYSPVVMPGTADILISFEPLEALRYSHYLKPGGKLALSTTDFEEHPPFTSGPTPFSAMNSTQQPRGHSIAVGIGRSLRRA